MPYIVIESMRQRCRVDRDSQRGDGAGARAGVDVSILLASRSTPRATACQDTVHDLVSTLYVLDLKDRYSHILVIVVGILSIQS